MTDPETIGFLASALVLLSSSRRGMAPLRAVAIASNLAFVSYGALADLLPVLLLHLVLLPTNVFRLVQALREQPSVGGRDEPSFKRPIRSGRGAGVRQA